MKERFLKIKDHNELAAFFGMPYSDLSKILYKTKDRYKYKRINILKKNGTPRIIKSPRRKIKLIQKKLSDILYEIYPGRPSAYGFVKNKSIVNNALQHVGKKYILNLDLKNFFDSIHFGRVRNLFRSPIFGFNNSVSTILAQLCCFDNSLPQGAPTSPILSNMIAWKLDAQLQQLAKKTNSTYTRYVDDITFSFTCSKRVRLPDGILMIQGGKIIPGPVVTKIILENGFEINHDKVRLKGTSEKMEVTGLTVNEFPNVNRRYVRQISSILHAWRKYGYDAAEAKYNTHYDKKIRATTFTKSLKHVVKGKLAFLYSVRGCNNEIFNKLAKQYNDLVENELQFKIYEPAIVNATKSLWVVEAIYDDEPNDMVYSQGTGFDLKDFGLITCAHVVSDKNGVIYKKIEAYKCDKASPKYILDVKFLDRHRDIAICELKTQNDEKLQRNSIELYEGNVCIGLETILLGFPAYKSGQSYSQINATVSVLYPQSGLDKFEISAQIREGNSGGPIIDNVSGKLVGVVLEGAEKGAGQNAALSFNELILIKKDMKGDGVRERFV